MALLPQDQRRQLAENVPCRIYRSKSEIKPVVEDDLAEFFEEIGIAVTFRRTASKVVSGEEITEGDVRELYKCLEDAKAFVGDFATVAPESRQADLIEHTTREEIRRMVNESTKRTSQINDHQLLGVNQPNAILDVRHLNLYDLSAVFMFYGVIGHSRWATRWN